MPQHTSHTQHVESIIETLRPVLKAQLSGLNVLDTGESSSMSPIKLSSKSRSSSTIRNAIPKGRPVADARNHYMRNAYIERVTRSIYVVQNVRKDGRLLVLSMDMTRMFRH